MFSLLAIVVTALVLGSVLLWRALLRLSRSTAQVVAIARDLRGSGATLLDRLFPSRISLRTARRQRIGMP